MKLNICILLALGNFCLAAEYSIDSTCDNRDDIKLRDGVIGAIQEGIELAENAFNVMKDYGSDEQVQKMCKLILGDDNFQNKFEQVKSTFEAVKAYSKEPSQFGPKDEGWLSKRGNVDVEIYCGLSRFEKKSESSELMFNTAMNRNVRSREYKGVEECYDTNFQIGSGKAATKAMTLSSDFKDYKAWLEAGGPGKLDIKNFVSPTEYACSMDICTWFTFKANLDGWPKIDAERIGKVKTEEFRAGLKGDDRPIDGLKTIGSTMLHELTHTNQGGKSIDVHELDRAGIESCYGWKCIIQLHNAENADSIAMLGMALKVWSLKHYVDEEGEIHPLP